MPEVYFSVQLPDGQTRQCYSPSTVVQRYFQSGEELTVAKFVARSREALQEASERVRAKYGFACTSAAMQITAIESFAKPFPPDSLVRILSI